MDSTRLHWKQFWAAAVVVTESILPMGALKYVCQSFQAQVALRRRELADNVVLRRKSLHGSQLSPS
jgi:hypothetical protein